MALVCRGLVCAPGIIFCYDPHRGGVVRVLPFLCYMGTVAIPGLFRVSPGGGGPSGFGH